MVCNKDECTRLHCKKFYYCNDVDDEKRLSDLRSRWGSSGLVDDVEWEFILGYVEVLKKRIDELEKSAVAKKAAWVDLVPDLAKYVGELEEKVRVFEEALDRRQAVYDRLLADYRALKERCDGLGVEVNTTECDDGFVEERKRFMEQFRGRIVMPSDMKRIKEFYESHGRVFRSLDEIMRDHGVELDYE